MNTLSIPRELASQTLLLALDIERSRPHTEDRKVEKLIDLIKKTFGELHVFDRKYLPEYPELGEIVLLKFKDKGYHVGRYFVNRGGDHVFDIGEGAFALDLIGDFEYWMSLPQ